MDSSLLGILLSLVSALGFAFVAVLACSGLLYVSFYIGLLLSLVSGLLLVGTIALVVDTAAFFQLSIGGLFWLALVGLLNFSLGRTFNFKAIQRIGVSRSTSLIGATPLVATIIALIVYGEVVSPLLGMGILLVVGGGVLVLWEAR